MREVKVILGSGIDWKHSSEVKLKGTVLIFQERSYLVVVQFCACRWKTDPDHLCWLPLVAVNNIAEWCMAGFVVHLPLLQIYTSTVFCC